MLSSTNGSVFNLLRSREEAGAGTVGCAKYTTAAMRAVAYLIPSEVLGESAANRRQHSRNCKWLDWRNC